MEETGNEGVQLVETLLEAQEVLEVVHNGYKELGANLTEAHRTTLRDAKKKECGARKSHNTNNRYAVERKDGKIVVTEGLCPQFYVPGMLCNLLRVGQVMHKRVV